MHSLIRLEACSQSEALDFYRRLSPAALRQRFCYAISDELIQKHCARLFERHRSCVLLGARGVQGTLDGLAEVHIEGGVAEVAIAVQESAQGRGLGGRLLKGALECAQSLGCSTATLNTTSDNEPMRHLATKAGMLVRRIGGTDLLATIALAPALMAA